MNFHKMSFKGFIWENNPEKITVSVSDKMSTDVYPKWKSSVSFVAEKPKIVQGEGVFFGRDSYLKINHLEEVFDEKSSGQLFIPGLKPMNAHFTTLEIIGEAKKDCVKYAFTFTQDTSKKETATDNIGSFVTVEADENLFDIANRTGVTTEMIMKLNDFSDLFSVVNGEQVRIR